MMISVKFSVYLQYFAFGFSFVTNFKPFWNVFVSASLSLVSFGVSIGVVFISASHSSVISSFTFLFCSSSQMSYFGLLVLLWFCALSLI